MALKTKQKAQVSKIISELTDSEEITKLEHKIFYKLLNFACSRVTTGKSGLGHLQEARDVLFKLQEDLELMDDSLGEAIAIYENGE